MILFFDKKNYNFLLFINYNFMIFDDILKYTK